VEGFVVPRLERREGGERQPARLVRANQRMGRPPDGRDRSFVTGGDQQSEPVEEQIRRARYRLR
jgi:hypothetical protein